jgi:hypothetical protein
MEERLSGREQRYVDTPDAAQYLGVSTAFLEKNRVTGAVDIPYIRLGRRVLYDLVVLDRVMAEMARLNTSEDAA